MKQRGALSPYVPWEFHDKPTSRKGWVQQFKDFLRTPSSFLTSASLDGGFILQRTLSLYNNKAPGLPPTGFAVLGSQRSPLKCPASLSRATPGSAVTPGAGGRRQSSPGLMGWDEGSIIPGEEMRDAVTRRRRPGFGASAAPDVCPRTHRERTTQAMEPSWGTQPAMWQL